MLRALETVRRFAADPKVVEFLRPAFANAQGEVTRNAIIGRLAPDAAFGVLAATQTPGDAFDKATAFTASTLGGGLGGALTTAATRGKLGALGELAGGYGGDMLGMYVGDAVSRGKDKLMGGEGMTPFERMGADQQKQFAQDLEQQFLAQYGMLVPGTREQYLDPTTGMGVN